MRGDIAAVVRRALEEIERTTARSIDFGDPVDLNRRIDAAERAEFILDTLAAELEREKTDDGPIGWVSTTLDDATDKK